ncbi:guanine nucleotide exchange protein for ADP-robosylation factor [Puccinia graminis f. sp. tritici]|uniref:Guanine nucleotide exchange protein for ADP-robosylation factor n=1 Tax=Puccinia graminis f. sp. tritici TaxID=56615 RepID=A0A5B0M9Y1_PUCGR|nr:guanine nucleotide exchange protein for ADP-robosylation factor [Puccinia graminis f. sp. tritici]
MDLSPIEQQQAISGLKQRTELTSSEDSPSPIRQNQDHHPSFDIQSESAQSSPTIVLTSHQTDRSDDQHPVIIHEQIDPRFGPETLPIKFHSPSFKPGSTQDNLANSFDDISLENNLDEPPKSVHQDSEYKEEEEAHHLKQPPSPQELPTRNPTPSTPISPENNSNNNHKGRSGSSSPALTVQSSRPTPSRDSTLQETSTIASFSTAQTVASTHSSVSPVLVISSLESIASSKEAKKSKELGEATKAALALLKGEQLTSDLGIPSGPNQEAQIILQPLKLACQTASSVLMVTALDCIGKLISYSFFKVSEPGPSLENNGDNPTKSSFQVLADVEMGDEVTGIICDCFADAACPDAVQLQIIKALLALVLAPTHPGVRRLQVHQSSLLRAVRTVYNIFLLSKSPTNQAIAQGTLTQIVSHVFGRVEKGEEPALRSMSLRRNESSHRPPSSPKPQDNDSTEPPADVSGSPVTPRPQSSVNTSPSSVVVHDENGPTPSAPDASQDSPTKNTDQKTNAGVSKEEAQVTLESFEKRNSFDGVSDRDAVGNPGIMNMQDYYVKDAFLVFRALCKLSMKPLGTESEKDLKSHAMRSKLLSLHLILSILNTNLAMFTDPNVIIYSSTTRDQTPFIQAIKQYLCLSLSRNAISSVLSVFELSCEIFWKVVSGMRTKLKKEIEVLLNEIFLPILEMRNSTVKQKSILLAALGRLFHDPQALVEVYLNYDCDRTSLGNIYERFMNIVSKLATTQYTTSTTTSQSVELVGSPNAPGNTASSGISGVLGSSTSIPPSLSTTSMSQGMTESTLYSHQSVEAQLKRQSLECLVAGLQSLVAWAGKGTVPANASAAPGSSASAMQSSYPNHKGHQASDSSPSLSESGGHGQDPPSGTGAPMAPADSVSNIHSPHAGTTGTGERERIDDPDRFQTAKNQKTTLIEGIRQFNFKPKRGIKFLITHGFIRSTKPKDVARFLLTADGLSKAMIGEYLGEGDTENVDTMHAFIDMMDFSNMKFTEAMRTFLQAFRLPGEAQKIDRFMLKFAERYYQGNPETLANAETAYVLAFSIILLNTDAHSPQVKNRMTRKEFIRNNRGINQGADLPEEYLSDVYDEILANEIRMKDEVDAAVGVQHVPTGLAGSIATVGRDLQKEAYVLQSAGMANKTEILFRTLLRGQRHRNSSLSDQFYEASHFEHVKPMFQIVWMPLLAGLSEPLQNTSAELEMIKLSLKGFKQSIKIVCLFDLELERNAFLTTLSKFTFLNNLSEMKSKNIETIKTLLDIALVDGNYLKSSWNLILNCVSQLERFQLISQGVDLDLSNNETASGRRSSTHKPSKSKQMKPSEEVTGAAGASHITYAADMVFSSSRSLSGTAIVDFVQALSSVSWEEIQASGLSGNPRTFCLQKLVEISYYNMGRIRLEWFQIWSILGEHFNQVCCHPNANVSFFALDSLRQLAMRFLEKDELANFKFQKDFLKPFEHTMIHSSNLDSKDMVLQCLNQMISVRVQNLRSGWRTMFGVFSAASKAKTERVVTQAFELVQRINSEHFSQVVAYGSFADLTVCITDFCKISQFQKVSLHAIEMLKNLITAMLGCPECPLSRPVGDQAGVDSPPADDIMLKFWFPILFAFYDITMNGEDLEVRKRALDYLFETLKKYGDSFSPEFWDSVCKEVLFPIFAVLRSRSDVSRFSTQEDMSVWLSTTMIQALRNLIDLYTFYFDTLGRLLDRLLDLLCECICQENDTLARIGTSCLQRLLENNVTKLDDERWDRVVTTFVNLFRTTTAYQLFDSNLRQPGLESGEGGEPTPSPMADNKRFIVPTPLPLVAESEDRSQASEAPMTSAERKKVFRQIIVKCVLQLLLVETVNELLCNTEVYHRIPPASMLRLLAEIDSSYRFAKKFNADKELRMGLWKVGFMKQLPNLLKQESCSAVTLIRVLSKLYIDQRPDHKAKRSDTVEALVPLALEIMTGYVELDPETQGRNIAAWTPVMVEVLHCFYSLDKETFQSCIPQLYSLLVDCLGGDLVPDLKIYVQLCLRKVGEHGMGLAVTSQLPRPLSDDPSSSLAPVPYNPAEQEDQ